MPIAQLTSAPVVGNKFEKVLVNSDAINYITDSMSDQVGATIIATQGTAAKVAVTETVPALLLKFRTFVEVRYHETSNRKEWINKQIWINPDQVRLIRRHGDGFYILEFRDDSSLRIKELPAAFLCSNI